MATLKASIALYDGMTSPLRNITNAVNILVSSFEEMQRKSRNAVDTASLKSARSELAKAETAFDGIEASIQNCTQQQQRFNQSIQKGTNRANDFWQKYVASAGMFSSGGLGIGRWVGAYLGMQGVKNVINMSDQMTSTNARLNLLVDDGGSVQELEDKIMASANRARASYLDTADAIAKMGLNAGAAFANNDELINFMELINKQYVIGGASAEEQKNSMLQLTQAMAAGALRGEELNSVLDAAPGIARSIEEYMGAAEGSIKKYAEQGLITADVIKNAMFQAADEINEKFESMPLTWAQVWTMFSNKMLGVFQPVLDKINELANSGELQDMIDGLTRAMKIFAAAVAGAFDVASKLYKIISENWDTIRWGVLLVAGAFIALQMAILAASAAQFIYNIVSMASPIGWIALGLFLIMAVLIALIAITYKFLDVYFGVTMWVRAAIINIGKWFGNLGLAIWAIIQNVGIWFMNLWEVIKACAHNIGVAFGNAWVEVQRGWNSLVYGILNGIKQIMDWLNLIPGVEISTAGISGNMQYFADENTRLSASKGEYKDIGAAWNTHSYQDVGAAYNTYQYENPIEAYNTGAAVGTAVKDYVNGLVEDAKEAVNKLFNPEDNPYNPYSPLDDIGSGVDDIAANTAEAADSLDIAEEDLSYLRDIAEREAVNRFTTAEISVNFGDINNNVSSDMDLDGIINYIGEGVYETMQVAAEGV